MIRRALHDRRGTAAVEFVLALGAVFCAVAGHHALQPYLDPDVKFSTGYGVNLPTTILYDAQGKEVWRVSGDMDWDGETAAAWIAEASK